MKNNYAIFLFFVFFVKFCFGQENYDIEYYNLELKSIQNLIVENYDKGEFQVTAKSKPGVITTYFEEIYLYYSEINKIMDELTIYKKQLMKKMYLPDGMDINIFWNKKEKKMDYHISYMFIVSFDIDKMIKGEDLNE